MPMDADTALSWLETMANLTGDSLMAQVAAALREEIERLRADLDVWYGGGPN